MKVDIGWSHRAHGASGTAPESLSPFKPVLVNGLPVLLLASSKGQCKGAPESLWQPDTEWWSLTLTYSSCSCPDPFLLASISSGSSVSHTEHLGRCWSSPLGLTYGFPWGLAWREGWVGSWCQWDSKWGHLTGSCLWVCVYNLGSIPALAVKLLLNSITSLFFINHKMSQPLLKNNVYRSADQDSGTWV